MKSSESGNEYQVTQVSGRYGNIVYEKTEYGNGNAVAWLGIGILATIPPNLACATSLLRIPRVFRSANMVPRARSLILYGISSSGNSCRFSVTISSSVGSLGFAISNAHTLIRESFKEFVQSFEVLYNMIWFPSVMIVFFLT